MKMKLHINADLQLLTTTQMNETWGGEFQSEAGEIELPKLPNLPASMPTPIPTFIPEYINE